MLKNFLAVPAIYNLKTQLFSGGRANVWRYLGELPKLPPHARVLDVGCGTGRHTDIFANRMVGVDLSRAYMAHAKRHHAAKFCTMDAGSLAFADATFDLVYAVGLFHHLPDAQASRAAAEMRRVLRPTGTALIVDAVLPVLTNPIGYALAKLDRGDHLRRCDALGALLAKQGFHLAVRNLPGSYPYERAVFTLNQA